jgi:hypothetical protein
MNTYKLDSLLKGGRTDVLAIHCGDYRLQAAFNEFLNRSLNLDGNYDLLVIPGGPLSLTLTEYLPKFSWASWKWLHFFVKQHEIRRLVLIQHQDCAFYQTMPLHLHDSPELRARQEQDLRRATTALRKELPELSVELYYAGWDATDHITIEAITG